MKKIFVLILIAMGSYFCASCSDVKSADVAFKKLIELQARYSADNNLQDTEKLVNDAFIAHFKQIYEENIPVFRLIYPFLDVLTDGQINEYGHEIKTPIPANFVQNLSTIYATIDHDMPEFINFLEKASFVTPQIVRCESCEDSSDIIEKNNALIELLFAVSNEKKHEELVFGVANRFFEYCFSEDTFFDFRRLLLNKDMYPITRMLYSVIWYRLAGFGWKNWCMESLRTLKERADNGCQVIYIAGGSDIYQLIKSGIYNIKNIDPQLPSQPKYYADEWSWIMCGNGKGCGIGDKIIFNNAGKKIVMERTGYQEDGTIFNARIATGQVITIPHSITTWDIFDDKGNRLGSYTLDRRFVNQDDFVPQEKTTLLMSFNELYYITLPDFMNGWGIEPSKFPENLEIVIKQLRRSVSKRVICNMRIADLLNTSDFKFISLGTCIN